MSHNELMMKHHAKFKWILGNFLFGSNVKAQLHPRVFRLTMAVKNWKKSNYNNSSTNTKPSNFWKQLLQLLSNSSTKFQTWFGSLVLLPYYHLKNALLNFYIIKLTVWFIAKSGMLKGGIWSKKLTQQSILICGPMVCWITNVKASISRNNSTTLIYSSIFSELG